MTLLTSMEEKRKEHKLVDRQIFNKMVLIWMTANVGYRICVYVCMMYLKYCNVFEEDGLHFCILWNFVCRLEWRLNKKMIIFRMQLSTQHLLTCSWLIPLGKNTVPSTTTKHSIPFIYIIRFCTYHWTVFFYRLINANTLNLCNDGIFYL